MDTPPPDLTKLRQIALSAAASDFLDSMGARAQCLPPAIGQMTQSSGPVVGFAFPVTAEKVDAIPDERYVGLLESLDAVAADDVYLISSGGSEDVALWGELLSVSCQAKGVAGVVCDGYVRDIAQINNLGFPCFARGTVPYDINGRVEVLGHGQPITIGGVAINRGDLIIGDVDGIVVVPADLIGSLVETVSEKTRLEAEFLDALRSGMKISDAFAKFHIL